MKNLDGREWDTFQAFGKNGILEIRTTDSGVDGIRLIRGEEEDIPYVTRTDANNGISKFVSRENLKYGSDAGNCIAVGLDTQTAFYQPQGFITGQNIQIITGKEMNSDTAQFLIPILKQQMSAKFNWGGNGATLRRMKKLMVVLPIAEDGNPDYGYMERYIRKIRKSLLSNYIEYVNSRITKLGETTELPELYEKKWSSFELGQIAAISSGKDIYADERTDGDTPYVTSGTSNNGIGYFVGNSNATLASNAISVNRNGAVGEAFYHPYDALFGNDCRKVRLKDTQDPYVQMFVVVSIRKQKKAFSYSRKLGTARLERLRILLPIDENGMPDYGYMRQYIKNMMLRKYRQYLSYLEENAKAKG